MKKIHLSIPEPCHENWETMTEVEKGRYCNACQKTVVDFTSMSDRQLAEFFKKPVSNLCGHLYSDQLNRDIEVPKKRIPWIKYFFQITWPALVFALKASAQTKGKIKVDANETPALKKADGKSSEAVASLIIPIDKAQTEGAEKIIALNGDTVAVVSNQEMEKMTGLRISYDDAVISKNPNGGSCDH